MDLRMDPVIWTAVHGMPAYSGPICVQHVVDERGEVRGIVANAAASDHEPLWYAYSLGISQGAEKKLAYFPTAEAAFAAFKGKLGC